FFSVDDPQQAAALLIPVGSVNVNLPRSVVGTGASGSADVVVDRGTQSLDAAGLVKVLTSVSPTVGEAERTPNVQAVWTGVAQAVGTGKPPSTMPAGVGSFADLTTRLFAGPVGAR